MISLALIGKDILHSRSQEIYERLLGQKINYKIFDCIAPKDLPSLEKIFKEHQGLSITSPYKKSFLQELDVLGPYREAINCIKKDGETYQAINTDYLAIRDIVDGFCREFEKLYFVILGDGVMSKVTQKLLESKNLAFLVLSRKLNNNFSNLDIPDQISGDLGQVIIINSCSRDYNFVGKLAPDFLFWDYNYDFLPHQQSIPSKVLRYIDGISMLELQGKYAIKFWDF